MSVTPLRMSPSRLADALACPGRIRGGTAAPGALSTAGSASPAARTGLICHRAFELFFSSGEALEVAWATAVAEQQELSRHDCDPKSPSNAVQPELLRMQYLRLERAIDRVTERLAPGDNPVPEMPLQSRDGQIFGTADLVVSGSNHWIADLKTGRIIEPEGGGRPEYVRQLMLYAYMEAEQSGSWPTHGWLVSLTGNDLRVPIDPDACLAVASRARTIAHQLSEGDIPLTPSLEACRWCHRIDLCPGPWEDLPMWGEQFAAKLVVTSVRRRLEYVWFEGRAVQGTVSDERPQRFRRVSVGDHPEAEALAEGTVVVVVGARWSEYSESWHLPSSGRLALASDE